MTPTKPRNLIFQLHRYLGLMVGLILAIVGLTGSLLVFVPELDAQIVQMRFGNVAPQNEKVPVEQIVETVKTTYSNHPDWKVGQVQMLPHLPYYTVRLNRPDKTQWEVFVNPYTGKVMGDRQRETAFFSRIYSLHYALLAGEIGTIIVGIAALLLFILSITGIVLWPGWRKLISGFKIKWDAHPKRLNYDLHKVSGIITAAFLAVIAFTGFCWNFYDQATPIIYAATLTPKPPEVKSTVVKDRAPLALGEALRQSDLSLPGAVTTFITLPTAPDEVFHFFKKVPGDSEDFNSSVEVDRYSGKVLAVQDSRVAKLGDRVLNSFTPLHYGTFGGVPTRILYLFVGLAPTVLLVTGFVMWRYRRRGKKVVLGTMPEPALARRE
ncbi:PepSY-associated TM helix domain-containing protein [Altericista sp. CCNU0014]|uniref:PepSY-associated TM helix domain-containing protein n=1 Tax=Altericista sp. CCNU0014 TaxID=3082949 RepID=UPI00384C3B2C